MNHDLDTKKLYIYIALTSLESCKMYLYSRTSMARAPLEPWKYVRDRVSSSK